MVPRELVLKLTRKDFERQTFRCGGNGGQNVNKVESGVRLIHKASGVAVESRVHRDQLANQRECLKKMRDHPDFRKWLRIELARRRGQPTPEQAVEAMMRPANLALEVRDQDGKWEQVPIDSALSKEEA